MNFIDISTKLTTLHNTLSLIETKGNNTKIMAECLRFTEQLIAEVEKNSNDLKPVESVEEEA